MLDDLRNSASNSFEEKPPENKSAAPTKGETPFLGMTAAQRFVVSLMIFLTVLVIGALLLVVADKVSINLPAMLGL